MFKDLLDEEGNLLTKGPYISLGLPFKKGKSAGSFFPDVPLDYTPHLHQEKAFERLKHGSWKSTVIATGTGSGKTECFLLPVIDHCLKQKYLGETGVSLVILKIADN